MFSNAVGLCATVERQTWKKTRNMSKTLISRPADNQPKTWPPRNDFCSGTGHEPDDEAICAGPVHNRHRFEQLLVQFLVVTLDEIKDHTVSSATDEGVGLVHKENISHSVLK